jgi:hypothetical protein
LKTRWETRRLRGWDRVEGFLTPLEAATLYRYASSVAPGATICEIGSYKGRSTVCLGRGLLDAGGKVLIAVDPFDGSGDPESASVYGKQAGSLPLLQQFKSNVAAMGLGGIVEIREGKSAERGGEVPELDLLFIDGDHSIEGCRGDYERYGGKVRVGGYLLFHDYDSSRKSLGPTWVVENLVFPSGEWAFIEKSGTLWVGSRLPGV